MKIQHLIHKLHEKHQVLIEASLQLPPPNPGEKQAQHLQRQHNLSNIKETQSTTPSPTCLLLLLLASPSSSPTV